MNTIKSIKTRLSVSRAAIFFLVLAVVVVLGFAQEGSCKAPSRSKHARASNSLVTARGVYAVDYTNRKVLLSRNANVRFFPASTVKLLTALVVLDNKGLGDRVIISRQAVGIAPTKAGLTSGASYAVEDLLALMLAMSANDAAVALAEAVAGSQSAFASLMNKKARRLGCRNSNFTNPTGLPDKRQVTTPKDLSLITRAAFSHSFISSAMKKKNVTVIGSDGRAIVKRSHNKFLWRVSNPNILVKTGYTRSARHCYAGIAYYKDRRVSVVILKSSRPWDDICRILNVGNKKGESGK